MGWLSAPFSWVRRRARVVALAIWLTCLLLHIAAVVLNVLTLLGHAPGVEFGLRDMVFGLVLSLGLFALLTFGVLIVARWPGHLMGWLFCGVGLIDALQTLGLAYELLAGTRPWPLLIWVVWLAGVPDLTTFLILIMVVPYLFPNGRLLSWRWWPLMTLSIAIIAGGILHGAFAVQEIGIDDSQVHTNPVRIAVVAAALDRIDTLGVVAIPLALLGAVASLGVRFQRARGVERLQMRWLLWMIGLVIAGVLIFSAGGIVAPSLINTGDEWKLPELVLGVSILLGITCGIPAVLGLSILRYRLYSIDLLINRTLVYGALTLGLAATYWGGVVLFQQALDPLAGSSDVAIAGSTLAVAALFRPLRRRIQGIVDRRFYRSKYDAAKTIDAFSSSARNQADLDRLLAELHAVVQETMQPASVSLWLRAPGSATNLPGRIGERS